MQAHQSAAPAVSSFGIVVGLDFAEGGEFAFRQAARIAQGIPGCHLHLVHVFDAMPSAEDNPQQTADLLRVYASEEASAAGGLDGVTIGIHLRAGDAVREIVQLATDVGAQLVVLGARKGPHLKSWLVGSTAEKVVAAASCPVLVAGPRPHEADAAHREVEIEPPCPDCTNARFSSSGNAWWCARHARHAQPAHVFSYHREWPLAMHDSAVIPTGIKF
jgi:nucleotide-binding universal stress UspA family protein